MQRTWGVFVLLFLGASCAFSSDLINDLYQRNDLIHINLLRNAVLMEQWEDANELSMLETYYIADYNQFIKDFDNKYQSLSDADNQLVFFYLTSKYKTADYSALKTIFPYIKPEMLSLDNWRDLQIIKAVSYYLDGEVIALDLLSADLNQDERSNKKLLETVKNIYQLQLVENELNPISADVDVSYYNAWNNLKNGKYDQAISFFDKAKKINTNPTVRKEFIEYGIGVTLYASGNNEEAIKQFSKDYTNDSLKKSVKFFQLLLAFDEKKYSEVITASTEILAMDEAFKYKDQTKYLRGASFYSLGDNQQAKKVLEEIKDFSPFVKYLLAEIYFEEGAYTKAKNYYQEAQKKSSGFLSEYASYGYAWSCFKLAQYKEAETVFEKNSLNKQFSEELRFNMMIKSADSAYNSGNYKDAEKKYREFLNKLVGKTDKYKTLHKQGIYNLAKVYMKLKDFKKANDVLETYLPEVKNDKETVIIKTIMANNFYHLKNYKTASRVYEELILMYKTYVNEDTYISLADSYFNGKEYGKALVVYQDYLEEYPKGERDMDANYGMVQTLYQLKDYSAARDLAKKVDEKYGIELLKEIEGKIKFTKETVSE